MESLLGSALHPYVECYTALLEAQDYKPKTAICHVQLFTGLSRWLLRTRRTVCDLNENVVEQFLMDSPPGLRRWAGGRRALCRLLGLLRAGGVAPPATPRPRTPAQGLADDYRRYLSEERGLDSSTIYHYARHSEKFLSECCGASRVVFGRLQAPAIIGFVQRNARLHGRGQALKMVTALRSFLRFLHYRGYLTTDLAPVVPAVAHWRMASLPKHLPAGAVQKILDRFKQTTAVGRRNYAILLLMARLGLRAGEVIALQLEDIDWEKGQITVRSKKGRGWAHMPLPAEVGKALARYLQHDRPRCSCRHVFVRTLAPYVPLSGSPAIAALTRSALKNAGVQSGPKGAPLFRHSLATEMLRQGASLDQIGQLLRHKDPDTTALYAKVDLKALGRLAVAWPGGGQ
jgi:integrase